MSEFTDELENTVEVATQQQAEAQYEIDENAAVASEKPAEEQKTGKKARKKFRITGKAAEDNAEEKHKVLGNTFVICFIVAVLINLFTETVARQSTPFTGGFIYMIEQPLVFLANTMIIYATLSISALFKRRSFVMALVSVAWLVIAISNGVILTQRMTPFNMKDMTALGDGITLMTTYFSTVQIVGLVIGITFGIIFFTIFQTN